MPPMSWTPFIAVLRRGGRYGRPNCYATERYPRVEVGRYSRARTVVPPRHPPSPSRAARILVVEDDALIAAMFRAVLERDGHAVAVAGSVEGARRAMVGPPPAVVLLDLALPDGDGLDL